jgi:glycosyltransferase involved in cell wall biosynthesis
MKKPRLLLFMSPGVGLRTWMSLGTFEREIRPYREYLAKGWDVTIATYDDRASLPRVEGFDFVFCPRPRFMWMVPFLLWRALREADVIRTNQSGRAWYYVLAAKLARRPLILRCGWVHGSVRVTREGLGPRLRLLRMFEGWAFRHADACQVATEADREFVLSRYRVHESRLFRRPNFVDPDLFKPAPAQPVSRSIICVGRLDPIKRLGLLLRAAALAKATSVTLIGDGPERQSLTNLAGELNLRVDFIQRVAQPELPAALRKAQVFVLPSFVEGHPKALIEAMACGLACIGTNVPGIREVIEHGRTGLLVEPEPAALAAALVRCFENAELRESLGVNAHTQITNTLSFARIIADDEALSRRMLPARGEVAADEVLA